MDGDCKAKLAAGTVVEIEAGVSLFTDPISDEKETPNSTTLSKKIAQGNLTASCKRLISWFLLYKATELGRKIVPV
ncbi:hypothetical protein TNCV_3138051 [Trichonephila clavipes]|nr:hypothetical protein TNCV_3138051 [Trichonephila clavipes]